MPIKSRVFTEGRFLWLWRSAHQCAAEDELLHVAARQPPCLRVHTGRLGAADIEALDQRARVGDRSAASDDAQAGVGRRRYARARRSPTAPGRRPRPRRGGPRGRRAGIDEGARPWRQRAARHPPGCRRPARAARTAARPARPGRCPTTPATATISPGAPRASRRRAAAAGGGPHGGVLQAAHGGPGRARPAPRHLHARPTMASASSGLSAPAAGSTATSWPARSTAMRCDTRSTSSSLWLMKMTARPGATIWRSVSNSASLSCGVSTAVGSSRISTRAPRYSALRISTRWRSPTDRSPTRACGSTARPKRVAGLQPAAARGVAARERPPQRLRCRA